jgi:hypothetical protein
MTKDKRQRPDEIRPDKDNIGQDKTRQHHCKTRTRRLKTIGEDKTRPDTTYIDQANG